MSPFENCGENRNCFLLTRILLYCLKMSPRRGERWVIADKFEFAAIKFTLFLYCTLMIYSTSSTADSSTRSKRQAPDISAILQPPLSKVDCYPRQRRQQRRQNVRCYKIHTDTSWRQSNPYAPGPSWSRQQDQYQTRQSSSNFFPDESQYVPEQRNQYRFHSQEETQPRYQPYYHQQDSFSDGTRTEEGGRLLSNSAFSRISETLGALNTVGHYLVNMVERNHENEGSSQPHEIPNALYTISKNVLGKNVTDTIAPFVRRVIPGSQSPKIATHYTSTSTALPAETTTVEHNKSCTTPEGGQGVCDDLSNCPQLLLNLGNLRESLCFKSLFEPGVCCPGSGAAPPLETHVVGTTSAPTYVQRLTTRKPTTPRPSVVIVASSRPKTTPRPTTKRPLPLITTSTTHSPPPIVINIASSLKPELNFTNIVNPEDCGLPEVSSGRVVGGQTSEPGSWPWMAAIFLHGARRTEFWCGGSLIGPRHILTAAHCTRDSRQRPFAARQFSVRLGDVDLRRDDEPSRPVTAKVLNVKAHESFTRVGFYNDIAILELDEPVRKSKYVIPLCLPDAELAKTALAGRRAHVAGWGTTRHGGRESSALRDASLPLWSASDCDRAYFQPITDAFLCAGQPSGGVDACQGDSGGPLMLQWEGRWTQVGVVSFGNKCGEPGYPGVYTRITHYLDWIKKNTI